MFTPKVQVLNEQSLLTKLGVTAKHQGMQVAFK